MELVFEDDGFLSRSLSARGDFFGDDILLDDPNDGRLCEDEDLSRDDDDLSRDDDGLAGDLSRLDDD